MIPNLPWGQDFDIREQVDPATPPAEGDHSTTSRYWGGRSPLNSILMRHRPQWPYRIEGAPHPSQMKAVYWRVCNWMLRATIGQAFIVVPTVRQGGYSGGTRGAIGRRVPSPPCSLGGSGTPRRRWVGSGSWGQQTYQLFGVEVQLVEENPELKDFTGFEPKQLEIGVLEDQAVDSWVFSHT